MRRSSPRARKIRSASSSESRWGSGASATAACHSAQAANKEDGRTGQVVLTRAEMDADKITVVAAGEATVESTLLTNGTVTLDDLRCGHVFSPVTGRVTKIVAQLGQRVKQGDALAVIESPDIGSALSDVHKAEADF